MNFRIAAVDPGLTTGFAVYDPFAVNESERFFCFESKNPEDVYEQLTVALLHGRIHLLVEDFISSSHLTTEAKQTLLVLGAFKYGTCRLRGIDRVLTPKPQERLAFVDYAETLIFNQGKAIRKGAGLDACQALAHCLAHSFKTVGKIPPFLIKGEAA